MRIILALHPSGNLSVPESKTWYHNFYEPLIELGHEVVLFNLEEFCIKHNLIFRSKKYKDKLSEIFVQFVKNLINQNKISFILTYFTDQDITPDAIKELAKTGVPIANFSCNNTHQFYLISELSPECTYSLHSEKDVVEKFKLIGANPVWFPMAANPNYYSPAKNIKYKYDVSFIGSSYALRSKYIYSLLKNDIEVHCFGPNWKINRPNSQLKKIYKEYKRFYYLLKSMLSLNSQKRYKLSSHINYYDFQCLLRNEFSDFLHYPISDQQMISTYHSSRINLGFLEVFGKNNDPDTLPKKHIHLREFEIPMSRNFYLTSFSEELAEHYIPDKEIVTFGSVYELIDKSKFYLSHSTLAEQIRNAGYQRAIKNHTYHKRFEDLFKKLKIK